MRDFSALFALFQSNALVVSAVIGTFVTAEALLLFFRSRRRQSSMINGRLQMLARSNDQKAVLVELRRFRGLAADGSYSLPIASLNRLIMQSGASMPILRLTLMFALSASIVGSAVYFFTSLPFLVLPAAGAGGVVLPLLLLLAIRRRRLAALEQQIPDAIDVMIRSLRAGHPVPVAISLVAREMRDPIGSEFGMVSDEMTYGSDMSTALNNLRARSGQSDLGMLAVAISIQSETGGDLAEVLTNLSRVVRARDRMRRKIKAISAEGRASAVVLGAIPLAIFGIIRFAVPTYYTDVMKDPIFMPAVYFGIGLWTTGLLVIRRMVNFKF